MLVEVVQPHVTELTAYLRGHRYDAPAEVAAERIRLGWVKPVETEAETAMVRHERNSAPQRFHKQKRG